MMKRSLMVATFMVAGGGAVAVGANTAAGMKGSDTLFDITTAMFAACPGIAGTGSVYAGSGSGNGQAAMVSGVQQVAPMSRFLNGGAMCAGALIPDAGGDAHTPITQAEGLVIGLDGVQIVGSKRTIETQPDGGGDGGTVSCQQIPNPTCDPNFQPNSGAAYNTTVNGYTFNGWRDVLRVLLTGFDHSATGTSAATWALRDCNSAIRVFLANNYGAFFENNCNAQTGDTTTGTGPCTTIRHIFRRDDFSGTTDTVEALLGVPTHVNPSTTAPTGATPFCNAVRPAFVFPAPAPTQLVAPDANFDPTKCPAADPTTNPPPNKCGTVTIPNGAAGQRVGPPITVGGATYSNILESAVYRATMQDNDPIRRTCAGTGAGTAAAEDVCSHSGDLGLVLPMNDVPEETLSPPRTNADRYNAGACQPVGGTRFFASASQPDVYDAITQGKLIATRGLLCPNGDVPNNLGGCVVPADQSVPHNPQCLSSRAVTPATTNNVIPVPAVNPRLAALNDGRSFNQHLYVLVGTAGAYQFNGFAVAGSTTVPPTLPMTGAFYRLHALHSLSPVPNPVTGVARTCQLADMTDQIGCLVEASPCSLGYAGRGSTENSDQNNNVMTEAIKINKQSPIVACIQGNGGTIAGFTYPLSRKLYLNSVPGFVAANDQELQLAGCETDLAQTLPLGNTPAGLMTTNAATDVTQFGFINIASSVNGGEPYCEDFNEQTVCGAAGNVNACAAAHPNFTTFPAFNTVCGNGVVDPYEDCDTDPTPCGAGHTCSVTCRCN